MKEASEETPPTLPPPHVPHQANQPFLTVLWAQRSHKTDAEKNYLYVTISVPDVQPSNIKIDLQPTSLSFTGHSDSLKRDYHVVLDLYAEIDTAETKVNHTAKNIQFVLRKKELKEEFWPRLLKDSKKVHFLKTDFDKWVDEDEQEEAVEDDIGSSLSVLLSAQS